MRLPNKLFSYNESVLAKLPILLDLLREPKTPHQLLEQLPTEMRSPFELIEALDCLFALSKIELDDQRRIIRC